MTAEQQLERSVLERKEREELRAIAQAMSLDTNSRSKKADIIDQILRAAGVEVTEASANGGSAAPARARAAAPRPSAATPRSSSSTKTPPTAQDAPAPTATRRRSRREPSRRRPQVDPRWKPSLRPATPVNPAIPTATPRTDNRRLNATTPTRLRTGHQRDPVPPVARTRTRTASTCSPVGAAPTNRATAGVVVAGAASGHRGPVVASASSRAVGRKPSTPVSSSP